MCLMLYLATPRPLAGAPPRPLVVEAVRDEDANALRGTVAHAHLALVTVSIEGGGSGCGCSFPYFGGKPVHDIEELGGPFGDPSDCAEAAAYVRALVELVERALAPGETAELFPVWSGNEATPAHGRFEIATAALDPDRFAFAESWLYALRS